jgi:hypothetical protein
MPPPAIILARPPAAILPFPSAAKAGTLLPVFHNHGHTAASHHLGFATTCHHLSHTAASHHFATTLVLPFTAIPSARLEALP